MRERLTLSFVVLTLVAIAGVTMIRSYSLEDRLRTSAVEVVAAEAAAAALALDQRVELERPVDDAFLAELVSAQSRLTWSEGGVAVTAVQGAGFSRVDQGADNISAEVDTGAGTLQMTQGGGVVDDLVGADRRSSALLLLVFGVLAGLIGYVTARRLSAPFRQLAVAAELLGRGRFDLELPSTGIPEVQAISTALHGSAGRLQDRLAREREFAQHASHVLRTPLTGLRLELEELGLREDLPEDARSTVERSLHRIDSMNVVAGELVELSRRGALVAGSEVPLRDLATACAQRWADTLAEHDRPLTAAVEGDLDTAYTPGPVEHILDLLLTDVLRRGQGPVRMVFDAGHDGTLKIRISCAGELKSARGVGVEVPVNQARAVITALGGRLSGDNPADGLEILLLQR